MSLSANELNYLIWRYLQEGGHELAAYALQEETKIDEYDDTYKDKIPLGCLVELVQKGILYSKIDDMIHEKTTGGGLKKKKTIVSEDIINLNFNLFNSIVENEKNGVTGERTILPLKSVTDEDTEMKDQIADELQKVKPLENGIQPTADAKEDSKPEVEQGIQPKLETVQQGNKEEQVEEESFTKVLTEYYSFAPSLTNDWNPSHPDVLSWGQRDSHSGICALITNPTTEVLETELKLLTNPANQKDTVAISWCPKGHSLLTSSETGELRLWDANGSIRFVMALHSVPVLVIKWSPNSSFILSLDISNKCIIWDASTGQSVQMVDNSISSTINAASSLLGSSNENNDLCFGTDACWLDDYKFVIPGYKYTLQVYQLTPPNSLTALSSSTINPSTPLGILSGHLDTISTISYNSFNKLLCSSSDDQSIRIWKGNSMNSLQVLVGHSLPITYLSWCKLPETKKTETIDHQWGVVSCSLDSSLRIWDIYKNKVLDMKLTQDGLPILAASLSPNNDKLVTGDSEGNVVVWKIESQNDDKRHNKLKVKFVEYGCYQPAEELTGDNVTERSNYISSLNWNVDGEKICVSYSGLKSCVIKV